MARKKYSEEEKKAAMTLLSDGLSFSDVSNRTGIPANTLLYWSKKTAQGKKRDENACSKINPLLLQMAAGNDLTPFVGKEITRMQPREIYAFLRLLNVKGDLVTTNTIKL